MLRFFRFRLGKRTETEFSLGFVSGPHIRTTLWELWQARWLVRQLIIRDLTVRYRQTWLGWLWAVLSPGLNLTLYYVMFGMVVHMQLPDYSAPYILVLLSGLVLWGLFQSVVNATADSLLNNLQLVKKIYFPRTALTVACAGVSMVDFLVALVLLIGLCGLYGVWPEISRLPAMLLAVILTLLIARGIGCVLAILKVRFRDIRHLTPLLMQAMFYVTPVVWTPGILSPRAQSLVSLNPLTGVMALFRYTLPGGPRPDNTLLLLTIIGSLVLALFGSRFFSHYEARVIDRE